MPPKWENNPICRRTVLRVENVKAFPKNSEGSGMSSNSAFSNSQQLASLCKILILRIVSVPEAGTAHKLSGGGYACYWCCQASHRLHSFPDLTFSIHPRRLGWEYEQETSESVMM